MTIRSARPDDADFIARTILSSQRGYRPRGWFDVALGWPDAQCRDFIARIATAGAVSMWHVSQFLVAEIDSKPAAASCAVPAAGTGPAAWRAIEEVAAAIGLAPSELHAIRQRGAYTRACWVQGGEGDWMIEHVSTDPAYRASSAGGPPACRCGVLVAVFPRRGRNRTSQCRWSGFGSMKGFSPRASPV